MAMVTLFSYSCGRISVIDATKVLAGRQKHPSKRRPFQLLNDKNIVTVRSPDVNDRGDVYVFEQRYDNPDEFSEEPEKEVLEFRILAMVLILEVTYLPQQMY